MPDVSFGGTTAVSWFGYNDQILSTRISVPARRTAANGDGPQLITHVAAAVAGRSSTVSLRLYASGKKTGTISRSVDSTPSKTSMTALTSALYLADGSTVSFGASNNNGSVNFTRSGSGTTSISPQGSEFGGTLSGTYRYIQSPTEPRSLTATPSTTVTGQVNLSWLSPSDDGGSSVTNYNVYRVSGSTYTLLGTTTTATTFAATGLTANTSFTFVVRARNLVTDTAGTQSIDSNTATATAPLIPPPVGAPGAPTALVTTTSTSILGAVGLSWTAPGSAGGGGATITGYDVFVNGVFFASTTGTGTTYTATGLTQLSTSSFTVLARNSSGFVGPQSTATSGKASGLPTAPTGLTAVADDLISLKINLSWIAPADSGGGITGYRIYNALTDALIVDQAGTGTTYSQTGLTLGQEYSYYVRAYNAIGIAQTPDQYGPASDTASETAVTVTGAPNVVASTTVAGRLIVTWTENAGATSYTIRNVTTGTSVVVSANILSYVADNLTAGTQYGFTKQPNGGDVSEIGYGTPLDTSIQTLATSTAITNVTNTQLSTATATITSAPSDSFTYAKTVTNLDEAQVSAPAGSALVTNKTNQALTDSDGILPTVAITGTTASTFTYTRPTSGAVVSPTSASGVLVGNLTNAQLNSLGASVTVPAGESPTTFTYTTTTYTGDAIPVGGGTALSSGGTATNLSQTNFNVTQTPITALTEFTLSYAKTAANQDTSAATGTIINSTNQQIFNKNLGNDIVRVIPDYKTIKYAVVGGHKAPISTTAQSGTTVTVTTASDHYFKAGDIVTIQGSTNGSGVFNGQWTIVTASGTTFTFTRDSASIGSTSDTAATADVDVSEKTVETPTDSVTRLTSNSGTRMEVTYRSGWIG